jgi:hypothetical protein
MAKNWDRRMTLEYPLLFFLFSHTVKIAQNFLPFPTFKVKVSKIKEKNRMSKCLTLKNIDLLENQAKRYRKLCYFDNM